MKALFTAAALCLTAALTACSTSQDAAPASMSGSSECCPDGSSCDKCPATCTDKSGAEMGAVGDGECSKVCPVTGKSGAEMGAISDKPSCSSSCTKQSGQN